jgi:SNF2 family DNA or RNA helicase
MLRRQKEDVEKSIPPAEETLVQVELTRTQKAYYRAVRALLVCGAGGARRCVVLAACGARASGA